MSSQKFSPYALEQQRRQVSHIDNRGERDLARNQQFSDDEGHHSADLRNDNIGRSIVGAAAVHSRNDPAEMGDRSSIQNV